MDQLFAIDAQARAQKLTQSDRHLLGQQKARPLLEQIKEAIEAARVQALPSSDLAKATVGRGQVYRVDQRRSASPICLPGTAN